MKKVLGTLLIAFTLTACSTGPVESTPTPPDESLSSPSASILQTTPEPDTNYSLDTSASTLGWEASRLAAAPHIGTVGLQSGSLFQTNGEFTGGEFVIDMSQITEEKNSERFLTHIKGEDFFGVEQYPTSKLTLTSVTKKEANQYELTGDLTIRDQTHPITFNAQMVENEGNINATSEFEIDRTKWGIIYDSGSFFQQLGDKAIKNEITYRLNLTFKK